MRTAEYKNFIAIAPGKSSNGEKIPAYKTEAEAAKYLYLLAGVHGDEKEGIYLLDRLLSYLDDSKVETPDIVAIPVLNIDGATKGSRVNANKVDLNRNLPTSDWSKDYSEVKYCPGEEPLSEPENRYLIQLFDKYPPYFIFSFHSWKPMINYNGDCQDVASFLSKYNSYPIAHDIGYPTPGSLGTYAPKEYNAPVITFECPVVERDNLPGIWDDNKNAMQQLFLQNIMANYLAPA